jgi:AcrR family transcriptional regulator
MKSKKRPAITNSSGTPRLPGLSRRESNKRDKLRRIKQAARELFITRGYDETTIREIASRAEVALGTIFTYAVNKRDLLFLIMNENLQEAGERALAAAAHDKPILPNLRIAFRPLYVFFSEQPILSRIVLREMFFYDTGPQARQFQNTRDQMIRLCTDLVAKAIARKEISTKEDAGYVGLIIFSMYQVEIRRWIANDEPVVSDGIRALERALELVMNGLRAPA